MSDPLLAGAQGHGARRAARRDRQLDEAGEIAQDIAARVLQLLRSVPANVVVAIHASWCALSRRDKRALLQLSSRVISDALLSSI